MQYLQDPSLFLKPLLFYMRSGGLTFLVLFLFAQVLYFGWKGLKFVVETQFFGRDQSAKLLSTIGRFILLIDLPMFALFGVAGFLLRLISSHGTTQDIAANNNFYMYLDKLVFGSYLSFWLQDATNQWRGVFDLLSPLIVGVFANISLLVGLSFIIVLGLNAKRFYQMAIAFILVVFLSVPMWYFMPALSPFQGYLENVMELPVPDEIQDVVGQYQPNSDLESFYNQIRGIDDEGYRSPRFTTVPSMHAGWATIAIYFGIQSWPWLAMVLIPIYILNFVGTFLTLQHYAIDPFAGALVAIATILVVNKIVKREPAFLTQLTAMIKEDMQALIQVVKNNFKK